MEIEFFYLRIERYFFKDRSEEKKYRAFKILDNGYGAGYGVPDMVPGELFLNFSFIISLIQQYWGEPRPYLDTYYLRGIRDD